MWALESMRSITKDKLNAVCTPIPPPQSADTGEAASGLPHIQDPPGPPEAKASPQRVWARGGMRSAQSATRNGVWSEGGVCEQSKGCGGEGTRTRGASPICNFPHGGRHRVSGGLRDRGLGSVPGVPREPLQVSRVEGPGLHKPVREESHAGGPLAWKNKTRFNSGGSPDTARSDLILSEVKIGAPRPHFNLPTHCSRRGKPVRHQSEVQIPAGKAAALPWRGHGTEHLWGQCTFCPRPGWLGLTTLPRDQGRKVTADLKEAAHSQACSEVPEVTLLPKEIIYQGIDI